MKFTSTELDIARGATILRGIDQEPISFVFEVAQAKNFANDGYIFMEEDTATHAYILLDGKIKLTQNTPGGQQVILGYLVPGRVCGIIAALKKVSNPVSAQAVGACRVMCWDQHTINMFMELLPRMALNALRIMAGQIRQLQNSVKSLCTQRVEQRIARAVLRLADQSGRKIKSRILIDLPLSRQDLAEMTGTTLYTVSRVLKNWEKRDLVQSKRQQVIVCSPQPLISIAEDLPEFDQ
ncbi:MAG: Crp/Fnr family transcriptional regulator [Anaerolineae bacterium]|nr:Crp/Fnr family transcriptional regulator [Anaerolineae bacterium]